MLEMISWWYDQKKGDPGVGEKSITKPSTTPGIQRWQRDPTWQRWERLGWWCFLVFPVGTKAHWYIIGKEANHWKGFKRKKQFRLDVPDFTLGDSWVEPAVNFSRVCILLKFHSLEEIGFQKEIPENLRHFSHREAWCNDHPFKTRPMETTDMDLDVSENSGTPKSSILIGFSIIFTIHFGVPLFLETPISILNPKTSRIVMVLLKAWQVRPQTPTHQTPASPAGGQTIVVSGCANETWTLMIWCDVYGVMLRWSRIIHQRWCDSHVICPNSSDLTGPPRQMAG